MDISIVIAYYNRRQLLIKTLESITNTKYEGEFEIVIVDDASREDQSIVDLVGLFPTLNLNIKVIAKENKWWINPCVPNNIGFAEAKGSIIIIQNPECLHMGDIVSLAAQKAQINDYLVFGCYAIDHEKTNKISAIRGTEIDIIYDTIKPFNNIPLDQCPYMNRWYQHSIYSPRNLNFCTAITKEDLNDLGGFDEKYAKGIGYDDTEFIARINKKDMNVIMIDSPIVVHQCHGYTNYSGKNWDLHMENKAIYENETLINDNFKVNINKELED